MYSEPEGNGWKFVLDVSEPAHVTFSIRCLTRQVSVTNGHTHDLKFEHIVTEVTIEAGKVNETQLTCADGSKGIVADMDLDDGLKSLGNDPRPVTRAFKLYNPTDHAAQGKAQPALPRPPDRWRARAAGDADQHRDDLDHLVRVPDRQQHARRPPSSPRTPTTTPR